MQPMQLCTSFEDTFENTQRTKVKQMHHLVQAFDFASFHAYVLRTHFKMHSGEKPNKCNHCDYASSRAGHLRTHLKIHSGEKLNKCSQCNYVHHLRTHFKIHSGEKPNKCNQCDYASSPAGHLRTHVKINSGEKFNKCSQCNYAHHLRTHFKAKQMQPNAGVATDHVNVNLIF